MDYDQYYCCYVVEAINDLLEFRQDQVDAGLRILGEQYAAVDDQQSPLELEDRHVAADVPETAQRRHAQGVAPQLRRLVEPMGQGAGHHGLLAGSTGGMPSASEIAAAKARGCWVTAASWGAVMA